MEKDIRFLQSGDHEENGPLIQMQPYHINPKKSKVGLSFELPFLIQRSKSKQRDFNFDINDQSADNLQQNQGNKSGHRRLMTTISHDNIKVSSNLRKFIRNKRWKNQSVMNLKDHERHMTAKSARINMSVLHNIVRDLKL